MADPTDRTAAVAVGGPTTDRYALRRAVAHLSVGVLAEFPLAYHDAVVPGCLLDTLGITPTHIGPGAARATMLIDTTHLNQSGVAQAGALVALADATAGWATYGLLDEGWVFTTLELKINLLRAARRHDLLVARCQPIHVGRTTCVLDVGLRRFATPQTADIDQDSPPLVAKLICTELLQKTG